MLRSLFVLIILVPGFFLALRSRFAALLLYLWFALFRPQDWLWIDVTPLRLSLVLGLVLLVPAIATGRLPNLTRPLTAGMALFIVSMLVSQIGAVRPDVGWHWIDLTVRLLLTSMLLVTLVTSRKQLLAVIAVIAVSMGYHSAKAGLMWLVGGGMRFADGLAGAFIDNNGYALGTVMIMPLLLATAQNASMLYEGRLLPWIQRGLYLAVPLCVFTVFGTYSRGGFLALATALLVFVLLQRRRFTTLAVLLSFAALVLLVVPIPQSYIDRLQTIRTYNEIGEDSALSRLHFWKVAINMGLSRPFGVGVRQYEAAYDQFDFLHGYFGHHRAVHNSHLQVFSELGFFGTFIWFAMFGWAFVTCLRVRARSRDERLPPADRRLLFTSANALMVSMAGFLVGGAFISLALNDITWLTFGLVAALDKVAASDVVMSPHRPKPAVAGFGDRGAADMPVGFRVHGVPASARRVPRDSRV